MNFLKRQVLFSRRENHLSHHEDFFNIVKLVTDEASNQFSPLFSENPLKHSRLKSHLCASTGVCSLLLLITHSDCYTLRVPAICPYYSHIARLRRPFMLIIRHPRNFQDTFVQAQVSWKFRGLVSYMSFVSSSFSITKLFSFIIGFLSINPSISDGIRNNSSLDISVQYVFPYIPAIVSLIAPML